MAVPSLNDVKKRGRAIVVIAMLGFCALILRLVYWQIIRGEEMSRIAQNQQQMTTSITTTRGKIYDRNGKVLAESASAYNLVCNPQDIKKSGDVEFVANKLSEILGMSRENIYKQLTANSSYQSIKKQVDTDKAEQIRALMDSGNDKKIAKAFSGVYFEDGTKRYYPYNVAATVLGIVNNDNEGTSGVEATFNEALLGKPGFITSTRSATGSTLAEQQAEYLTAAADGADVVLTIDETIQHFLESQLEKAAEDYKLKEGAAGIVMNPKTGEILAMSTKPDFNSNDPYNVEAFYEYLKEYDSSLLKNAPVIEENEEAEKQYISVEQLSDEQVANFRNRMWRNKAISDSYEPGSTFKIITAAAALEEHLVDDNSTFYCPGFKIVEDRRISCANRNGHGPENFRQGVQNSCNPVFMELGIRLGSNKFKEYFNAFGFDSPTGIELGGESSSISYSGEMNDVDLATSAFGQGIQVTPIQLITAISSVINGGVRMKPHIVEEIRSDEGVLKNYEPEVINRVISEETSARMREILESVVGDSEATGRNAYVKGYRIGGKTGTSEKMPRGTDARIASFIGFAPANDPQVVCLIMLDEPQIANRYGGTLAAPLTGELIESILDYLGVEKQYNEEEEPERTAEVPDVRDDDIYSAEEKLIEAGFYVKVMGGGVNVAEQLPQPGNMMPAGSTIILYTDEVSEEDMLVTVPDVTGASVKDAKDILQAYSLNFKVTGAGHAEAYGAYSVGQSVAAGDLVQRGTAIGVEFRQPASD